MSSEDYLLSLLTKDTKSSYAETASINQRVCPLSEVLQRQTQCQIRRKRSDA